MACDATHPLFHVSPMTHLSDHGDLVFPHTNLIEMRKQLEATAYELLKQCPHVVWLGGDHSITLSLLRAHYKLHGTMTKSLLLLRHTSTPTSLNIDCGFGCGCCDWVRRILS